jgi:hypothetical protein
MEFLACGPALLSTPQRTDKEQANRSTSRGFYKPILCQQQWRKFVPVIN